jgi:hypothetical protein
MHAARPRPALVHGNFQYVDRLRRRFVTLLRYETAISGAEDRHWLCTKPYKQHQQVNSNFPVRFKRLLFAEVCGILKPFSSGIKL